MKSGIIMIDNTCNGFSDVRNEVVRVARYMELPHRDVLRLQLLAEEMLSLARSVTGEMNASFWVENDGDWVELHMTTKTVMDKEKRSLLIASSTSGKNDAARSFLGKLRDALEQSMLSEGDHQYYDLPDDFVSELPYYYTEDQVWDGYEQSTLKKLADDIKVGVRGKEAYVVVSKRFAK